MPSGTWNPTPRISGIVLVKVTRPTGVGLLCYISTAYQSLLGCITMPTSFFNRRIVNFKNQKYAIFAVHKRLYAVT